MIAGSALRALALPVALLATAELVMRGTGFESDSLAPPSAVFAAFGAALSDGSLLRATVHTLYCAGAGLVLGGGFGLLLGVATGLSPAVDATLSPTIEALRPVPAVVLVPVTLLVFGFGPGMEIASVAFGCIWPVLILTRGAVAGTDPALRDVSRALQLGTVARITKITFPAALPRILVAVRLAAGIALIVAVTAEITANPRGLGYTMMVAEQTLRPDLMLACLLWIGVLGFGINALLSRAQQSWLGAAARAGRS